ncbi:MAG: HNH endonuclease [Actinobacteria bacterium]|nr:HNH endonuclease [Actinomycetota bacterium]
MTTNGAIHDYGRSKRIATVPQRRALTARDRGCSFPGCTTPPAWTRPHHITPRAQGGPTDLDIERHNAALTRYANSPKSIIWS